MLIKIVKSLGCAHGCGEGHRGLSGDRLRMQVRPFSNLLCEPSVGASRVSIRLPVMNRIARAFFFFIPPPTLPVPSLSFQAQNCLTSLYKLDTVQFRQTIREYVNKDSLNNIVDFLHALLGFCMEPITDSKYGGVRASVGPEAGRD